MVGQKFGKLTVIAFSYNKAGGQKFWKCKCECGKIKEVREVNLKNGSTQSCGCGKIKNKPKEDLIGQKFNHLTVVKLMEDKSSDGRFLWSCTCDCGSDESVIATAKDLKCNRKSSCSCLRNKKQKLPVNLIGKKFGLLTVIRLRRDLQKDNGQFVWECTCDCRNTTYVLTGNLTSGGTKSCGCMQQNTESPYKKENKDKYKEFQRLLSIWTGMKKRCTNPKYENYDSYGGRGIKVCSEWNSFRTFYEWALKNGYYDKLQIDRKDVNGDYEPSNCRWVTPKENSNNKRNNKVYTINQETKTQAQWAEIIGISPSTFSQRIKNGWTGEELLIRSGKRNSIRKYSGKLVLIKGQEKSCSEWAEIIGISQATLRDRINAGWSDEELLKPKGFRRKYNNDYK